MRIGMMADTYKPHISGITNYIALNKRYLEREGHDVFVFTFGDLDYPDDETRIIRSPGLPLVDTGYYLNFRYIPEAKNLLQTMDVVHVHHPFLSGRLALRYCHPLQIPIVFTNHTRYDLYAQAYLPMLPEEISDTLLEAYMPNFCGAVDKVISPSEGMARVLRELGVDSPIEVVPNGVELQRYFDAPPISRTDFGYAPDDILLIYVGRLGPEKNLTFLLQAFSAVAEALDNVHLLLLGDGPARDELETLAGEMACRQHIRFNGMVAYDQLPGYLTMCDAFVTASETEVHPLSVIEAMGAGLPVMGVQSVGVGDTVLEGQTGFLSTPDPAAFAAKLTRLCLQSDLRREMGAAARRESTQYAIERTTQLMTRIYDKLIYDSRPRKRDWRVRLRGLWERMRQ
jgi:glycosyltransferase involved in cell wall biosynthesis